VLQNLCTYSICVIDTASIDLKVCTTRGLHLNSQGKKKLTYLTAKRVSCGHVASISCIPVVIHATASSFSV